MIEPDHILLKTSDLSLIRETVRSADDSEAIVAMGKSWRVVGYFDVGRSRGGAHRVHFDLVELRPLPGPSFIEISG